MMSVRQHFIEILVSSQSILVRWHIGNEIINPSEEVLNHIGHHHIICKDTINLRTVCSFPGIIFEKQKTKERKKNEVLKIT